MDTVQELQDVASTWSSTMRNNGMSINTAKGKTEFTHFSRRTKGFDVCIGDVTVNPASSYKNLGVMEDEKNNKKLK